MANKIIIGIMLVLALTLIVSGCNPTASEPESEIENNIDEVDTSLDEIEIPDSTEIIIDDVDLEDIDDDSEELDSLLEGIE